MPRVTVAVVARMLGISLRVIPHAADAADCCSEHERWVGIVCGGSCEEDLQQIAQLTGTQAAGERRLAARASVHTIRLFMFITINWLKTLSWMGHDP